ncbi:MAG: methylmalonyl-CoA mutase subunit beta [Rhizobiales bacterium]|nr:methylmalonyl-CoA mutase subunit beta [Hyphomicrobiales bacterium]
MTLLADLALAQTFPATTDEQWRKLVEAALKGGSFDRLVGRTADGLAIEPLYRPARADRLVARGASGAWAVSQRVDHPSPAEANALALADLEGGASGLTLVFAGAQTARGYGLVADTLDQLDRALEGVMLDLVPIRLEAGDAGRRVAALFAALVERRKLDPASLTIDFGGDPLTQLARTGRVTPDRAGLGRAMADTSKGLAAQGFRGRAFLADGRAWHEAGASEAQELGLTLAAAVETLRLLEANGVSLEAARDDLAFLLVADADEFLSLAKFRALRRLWARVEEAAGLAAKPLRLNAETAWRMTTKRDPWVNLLRATVAVFSAGLGGADAVTVLPFTAALGLPDAHARRMARNTQLILLEESNLARVVDPAAGAGGLATLTEALCEKAWGVFQQVEREGGLIAALEKGAPQALVAAVAGERAKAIARRKIPITGASEFPNVSEAPVEALHPAMPAREGANHPLALPAAGDGAAFSAMRAGALAGAKLADLAGASTPPAIAVAALPSLRDAEPFEALREAADARPARPTVFLANLGPVAAFTARATFAKNFFEAGGIAAPGNDGFADEAAMVAAFRASGGRLACLCSSDAVYAEQAAAAARALTAAGATVWLAGRPGDLEAALKEAGVAGYVFAGADVLATLKDALAKA